MLQKDQMIYEEIGKLLWSIMPKEAREIVYRAKLYDGFTQAGARWFDQNGQEQNLYTSFDDPIILIERQIKDLLETLQQLPLFQPNPWTQCKVTLNENGKFNIQYFYIPEEDSWTNIILKGISDLTEDEWRQTSIPRALWEERVQHKGTNSLGRPKSDFY